VETAITDIQNTTWRRTDLDVGSHGPCGGVIFQWHQLSGDFSVLSHSFQLSSNRTDKTFSVYSSRLPDFVNNTAIVL